MIEWPTLSINTLASVEAVALHLDFAVEDIDEAEGMLLELGAAKPEHQPDGDRFRVLTDPAGHPLPSPKPTVRTTTAAPRPESGRHLQHQMHRP